MCIVKRKFYFDNQQSERHFSIRRNNPNLYQHNFIEYIIYVTLVYSYNIFSFLTHPYQAGGSGFAASAYIKKILFLFCQLVAVLYTNVDFERMRGKLLYKSIALVWEVDFSQMSIDTYIDIYLLPGLAERFLVNTI